MRLSQPSRRSFLGLAGAAAVNKYAAAQYPSLEAKPREAFITPQDFLAAGAKNHHDAIQKALDAAAERPGSRVFLPTPAEGRYTVSEPLLARASGIRIEGASDQTLLVLTGPDQDGIVVDGAATPTGRIGRISIRSLFVVAAPAPMKRGASIKIVSASDVVLEDLVLEKCGAGLLLDRTNNVTLRTIAINHVGGDRALRWTAPAGARSDVLTVEDLTVQNGYNGADGFVCDGNVQTLRWHGGAIMGCKIAFWVQTTRSKIDFPAHFFISNLETDGQLERSVLIDAGQHMVFLGCDLSNTSGAPRQGSRDHATVEIRPDRGFSETRDIEFIGGRIGNTQEQAMLINARHVRVTGGAAVGDASKAGVGKFPVIEIGPEASQIMIIGSDIGGQYGQPVRASRPILIRRGASRVLIIANNFNGAVANNAVVEDGAKEISIHDNF